MLVKLQPLQSSWKLVIKHTIYFITARAPAFIGDSLKPKGNEQNTFQLTCKRKNTLISKDIHAIKMFFKYLIKSTTYFHYHVQFSLHSKKKKVLPLLHITRNILEQASCKHKCEQITQENYQSLKTGNLNFPKKLILYTSR